MDQEQIYDRVHIARVCYPGLPYQSLAEVQNGVRATITLTAYVYLFSLRAVCLADDELHFK